jgi:hypothetical protein
VQSRIEKIQGVRMKFAKLSMAAVAVVGFSSSAMALDLSSVTAKPYVKTKLWYETVDNGSNSASLFGQSESTGDAVVQAGVTGALNGCWGYGLEYSVADTLGLENDIVKGARVGLGRDNATDSGADIDNSDDTLNVPTRDWMSQAYLTFRGCGTALDKTTIKVGRQYLNTPLAFTENWNAAPNSFDAMVAINSNIDNVTIVAAHVGKGNGGNDPVVQGYSTAKADLFTNYVNDGAHAVGLVTNFGIPVNLWYYNVHNVAEAIWADASASVNLGDYDVKYGIQYGEMEPDATGFKDSSGVAAMLGTTFGNYGLSVAYSEMDDEGYYALANTATNFKKTKMYTAGVYTDGLSVAVPGSEAMKIKATAKTSVGNFALQYIDVENDKIKKGTLTTATGTAANTNQQEIDLIYSTKVLGINTKLILMNRSFDDQETGDDKKDSDHVRVILSKNF